ncbi:MAG: GtrA family protein [Eubacteriales bacterium]|nr:GtrA family protein [Christensenellaceae bacterium]MDY2750883.1 GtrA family protein [Eubacteriales bacterium]
MTKQKLTAEEKAAKKEARKEKFKAMNEKNGTKWQAFKYLLCTASAGIIQFVSFTIMTYAFAKLDWGTINFITPMPKTTFVATTVALCLSVLWNFTLNRKFTFKSAKNVPVAMALAFLFYVPFYPFQTWYVHVVSEAIGGQEWSKLIAEATVMLINGVLEFCWQKFVIYRKSANTAGVKKDNAEQESVNENHEEKIIKEGFVDESLEIAHIKNDGVDVSNVEVSEEDVIKKG